MSILLVLVGIPLLYFGGELLVKYASRLALALGLSPLVIGLTIVAFGTSSPELVASLTSEFQGAPDVAMGNVIGSNIANISFILGISALIYPVRAQAKIIKREIPIMIFAGLLLVPISWDLRIARWEGLLLFSALVAYLVFLIINDRNSILEEVQDELNEDEFTREYGHNRASGWKPILGVFLGVVLLVAGAQSLVTGAIDLARSVGVSERVIGISLVAFSTSLPELASSVVASMKQEGDILLGNIIGSNIFNALGILGLTALINPIQMSPEIMQLDIWVAIGVSILVLPILATGFRMERWEGAVLVALYIGYIVVIYG